MAVRELQLINDRVLVDRARHGDVDAHDELWTRWAGPGWRLAVAVARDEPLAEQLVVGAWASVVAGTAPVPEREPIAMLLAAVRREALISRAAAGDALGGDTAVRRAFAGLPERLRSALWLVDAEQASTQVASTALQVPIGEDRPLADRARAALAERAVAEAAAPVADTPCGPVMGRLTDYAGGRMTERESTRMRRHLDGCERCRDLLAQLDDLVPTVRALAVVMPIGLDYDARCAWRAALVQERGPLHLMWLGQPVPPWAERVLAGAAAAVVAFGISTAVILAGRNNRGGDGEITRQDALGEPLVAPDGESALGTDDPLDGLQRETGSGGTDASPTGAAPEAAGDGSDGTTAPVVPRGEEPIAPAPTPTPDPGPAPVPPPSEPDSSDPALQVGVSVPGVVEVAVGDECTGVSLLGTVVGCEPPETEEPLELGGSLLGG